MAITRARPEIPAAVTVAAFAARPRMRWPMVWAVLLAYLMMALLQPEQIVYLVLLFPFALVVLEIVFEIAEKLDGR